MRARANQRVIHHHPTPRPHPLGPEESRRTREHRVLRSGSTEYRLCFSGLERLSGSAASSFDSFCQVLHLHFTDSSSRTREHCVVHRVFAEYRFSGLNGFRGVRWHRHQVSSLELSLCRFWIHRHRMPRPHPPETRYKPGKNSKS